MEHALARRVTAADALGIARALTVVENDPEGAAALLEALAGSTGRAHRVGVTGPPGAGKSTLVAALAAVWRASGRRVGIVAVDPTSPFSGGALLGDRVRMGALAGDAGVFIRSFATRGAVGGLSRAANDACDVLDAAGFDVVAIETVGVGQNEISVAATADTVVVVVAPGSGDAIQAMKGGLLEVADLVVVNQGDRPGADALVSDLAAGIELRESAPRPAVLRTVATTGEGVAALAAAIDARRAGGGDGAALAVRRRVRAAARIREEADRLRAASWWGGRDGELDRLAGEVAAGRMAVARAVGSLLAGPPASPGAGTEKEETP